MKNVILCSSLVLIGFITCVSTQPPTALDNYVNKVDLSYSWYEIVEKRFSGPGYQGFTLNMTSQTWLKSTDFIGQNPNCHIWWHQVLIVIPIVLNPKYATTSTLYIKGGYNDNSSYSNGDQFNSIVNFSLNLGIIGALLNQIPNEPCIFSADPQRLQRTEDGIIAFGWAQYLQNTSQPEWLLRLPMVKSVVRAMDAITAFVYEQSKTELSINQYVTMGESKRGWTTWLTSPVDKRIIGTIPIVMSVLNFQENLHHYWRAFNGWSFVFEDYYNESITARLDTLEVTQMMSIIDPYMYSERLKRVPIYNIETTGDELFMPDDSLYWRETGMKGIFHQRMMPNCEHSLTECRPDTMAGIQAWLITLLSNDSFPRFKWSIANGNGTITVQPESGILSNVLMWYAHTLSSEIRDFREYRMGTGGPDSPPIYQPIQWFSQQLKPNQDGTYTAWMTIPDSGWTGLYVEMRYTARNENILHFTTDVSIIPQTFPFSDCHGTDCRGTLL
ncbi:unnamed protein product [Didymodactylos carnosus]|uniref:Uncharacterized protein n=1 Tax=Didymodactylos carnosus TaxID=1234261 RepID=A0A814V6S1_9BILA|nr:unnamed protein product [Didymodactylos carnosus]CAF1187014.1 unnamed protein product [Didymodactylos carnosus]CAF3704669.1 unnamed protein product [Didymodactylos carnosus]CAF3951324.1 unnamed protein product [Didymodactylos carnosus]